MAARERDSASPGILANMTATATKLEVHYPESDGMPMAETDVHRRWMIWLIDVLMRRYRGERVYVSGDLFIYYVEGHPKHCVAPDAFVVLDCDPGDRRVFKTWEEGRVPNVVWEVTSRYTERVDESIKPTWYQIMGVPELFYYDPTQDYMPTPLMGYRLDPSRRGGMRYESIVPDSEGRLLSQELGLHMSLDDDGGLVVADAATGARLLTDAEAEAQARQAEAQARQAEAQARQAAEAEVARLKALLHERNHGQ